LKCCLNFELDTYVDALKIFPDNCETLETAQGIAYLQKKDIFKNLLWYCYRDSSKQYPLTIDRVKEIKKLNNTGVKPEELQPVELEIKSLKPGVKVEMGFVNDVGQISLRSLEKSSKKKNKTSGSNKQHNNNQQQKQVQVQKQTQLAPNIGNPQQPRNNQGKRPNQNHKTNKK